MKPRLLNAVSIAAWLFIALELIILGLGFVSIAVGDTVVGGGPAGLLVQSVGLLRTALYGIVPLAILLIVIQIHQSQGS